MKNRPRPAVGLAAAIKSGPSIVVPQAEPTKPAPVVTDHPAPLTARPEHLAAVARQHAALVELKCARADLALQIEALEAKARECTQAIAQQAGAVQAAVRDAAIGCGLAPDAAGHTLRLDTGRFEPTT